MRVFVTGATGVLGRESVTALVAAGHEVTGVARGPTKAELIRSMGGSAATVDLFDPVAVADAVRGHDAVCNLATNIPTPARYFRRSPWETNSRLHAEASRNLVDGAIEAGATRYTQHSVAFMYADAGDRWLDESAPIDPPPHGAAVVEAEAQSQRFTDSGATGVAPASGSSTVPVRRRLRTFSESRASDSFRSPEGRTRTSRGSIPTTSGRQSLRLSPHLRVCTTSWTTNRSHGVTGLGFWHRRSVAGDSVTLPRSPAASWENGSNTSHGPNASRMDRSRGRGGHRRFGRRVTPGLSSHRARSASPAPMVGAAR